MKIPNRYVDIVLTTLQMGLSVIEPQKNLLTHEELDQLKFIEDLIKRYGKGV